VRSSTRRSADRPRRNGDTHIRRSDNVIDLSRHRAQRRPLDNRSTKIRVDIDADGFIDYEINVCREDADRVTDVLLMALLKAREARSGRG
jgi:hypothetical protein